MRILIAAIFILVLVAFPFIVSSSYLIDLAVVIFLYSALALSWDIIARTGLLSLAHHAFFGIGAYTSVLICINYGLDPILSMILGGVVASLAAAGIGAITLKLRGLYFAIATLAFAGFMQVVVLQLPELTGGAGGITLQNPLFGGNLIQSYLLAFLIFLATLGVAIYLSKSKYKYSMAVIASNEIVAKTFGINVPRTILKVFMISSFFPGFIGAYYVHYIAYVNPHIGFDTAITLAVLAMTIFGGMGTNFGPVIGAAILKIAEEILRISFAYGHMIVYGIILIVVILFFPKGLMGIFSERESLIFSKIEAIKKLMK